MDMTGHMNVIAVSGNNAGLKVRSATFAKSAVFEFIDRPHLDVFNHERFIYSNIDFYMKLMPSPNNFVCKSAVPGHEAQQENYRFVIQSVNFIIHVKKLTSTAHGALMDLFVQQYMRHHWSRVQMKLLSIPAN